MMFLDFVISNESENLAGVEGIASTLTAVTIIPRLPVLIMVAVTGGRVVVMVQPVVAQVHLITRLPVEN